MRGERQVPSPRIPAGRGRVRGPFFPERLCTCAPFKEIGALALTLSAGNNAGEGTITQRVENAAQAADKESN